VSEQPFLGIALLTYSLEGFRKGNPNIAYLNTYLVSLARLADVHLCARNNKRNKSKRKTIGVYMSCWNVRTLVDSAGGPERRTAIVAKELGRYNAKKELVLL